MSLEEHDEPPPSPAVWHLFRRDEPDPRAIQAAYLRFAGRRPERLSPLRMVRWLAVGFVAGLSVAFAATGAPLLGSRLFRSLRGGPGAHDTAPAVRLPVRAPVRARAEASAVAPAGSAASADLPTSPGARTPAPVPHATLVEPGETDPTWQRAAAALKAHDYAAAEKALREVEMGGVPGDRDAASLALAQVLLTRGREVEARARLERLRARGSSPLVREKAAALLGDTFSSAGRSSAVPAVPQ
jgi:hypothetical protein